MAKERGEKQYKYADADEISALQGNPVDTSHGIPCKVCGCRHHITLETRSAPKNTIRRRRKCRNCGLRFTTYEDLA